MMLSIAMLVASVGLLSNSSLGTFTREDYVEPLPNSFGPQDDFTTESGVYSMMVECPSLASYLNANQPTGAVELTLFNVSLFDDTTGSLYRNWFTCSIYFELDSQGVYIEDSMQIACRQYDYDTPFGTYPTLNYQLYCSCEFLRSNVPSAHSSGDSLMTLMYGTNESFIDAYSGYNPYLDSYHIYFNFLYLNANIYDGLVLGMTNEDYNSGYAQGYKNGEQYGREQGVQDFLQSQAYQDALQNQFDLGELQGISEGRQQVIDQGQTASIIFNGIISVGLLPVNVFLQMLNLEVFGINIGALVSSMLTIMVIIIIVRMIIGGKSGVD